MSPVVALFGRAGRTDECRLLGVQRTCRSSGPTSVFEGGHRLRPLVIAPITTIKNPYDRTRVALGTSVGAIEAISDLGE